VFEGKLIVKGRTREEVDRALNELTETTDSGTAFWDEAGVTVDFDPAEIEEVDDDV
jgi:hypothetical protein